MGGTRLYAALALVTLTGFITTLDNTVANVALPTLQRVFSLDSQKLEQVGVSYVLSFGALLLLGGRLADLWGRRALLAWGHALFAGASVLAGLSGSADVLIAARTAQGVGAALLVPAALSVVAADLPANRRPLGVGLWTAALAVALALGPLTGGLVTEHWSWRWVFLMNVPFSALALPLIALLPGREKPARAAAGARVRLDLPGVVLSGTALYALTYALLRAGESGFGDPAARAWFLLAAPAGVAFVLVERRARDPLVDAGLFRSRLFSGGTAAQVLWGVGVNGVFFFTALFLQDTLGFSPGKAGLAFLPLALALMATTPLAERLSAAYGAHRVVSVGLLLVAGGLLLVAGQGHGATYLSLQPGLLVIGAGSGLTVPLTLRSMAEVPPAATGMASGVISAAREVSGAIGIALVGLVLQTSRRDSLHDGTPPADAFLHGYRDGLHVAAGCVALGALITFTTLRLRGRHRRTAPARVRTLPVGAVPIGVDPDPTTAGRAGARRARAGGGRATGPRHAAR
ncbi:MFS transporter [Streptomyces sp. B1866]|uniref:MFS transporter n=1 Tax=Streptomyces sp. B1866 TaxID=3075431 RepID=UPI00288CFFE1|nr:MFS transporter [Streptomyces sp. B1866]MDT3395059.1 MFS transporter [Streptomyces sp. B1866]